MGNIVNRVFDSSGPEGKVRGTPQQIIDKYLMLARDAQLGNDRVAEQNFLQHAEHYTRMLGEAQAELLREQAERQPQQGGNGGHGGQQGGERMLPRDQSRQDLRNQDDDEPQPDLPAFLTNVQRDEGSSLVETPEAAHGSESPERRPRRDDDRPGRERQGDRFERQGDRHGGERRDRNERRHQPDRDERKERPVAAPAPAEGTPVTETAQPPRPHAPASDLFQTAPAAQPAAVERPKSAKQEAPEATASEAAAKPARAPRKPRVPKAAKPETGEEGEG